jgi:hypothetical protein
MRFSRFLFALLAVSTFSFLGCGRSNEPTSVDSGELQSYVEDNADALAAEDAAMEAEDAEEDADDE